MVRLVFLGTGGGRFMVSTQVRSTAGFLINFSENFSMYVDPGPGAIFRINQKKRYVDSLRGIFVSHVHLDHAGCLFPIMELISKGGNELIDFLICPYTLLNCDDTSLFYLCPEFKRRVKNLYCFKENKRDRITLEDFKVKMELIEMEHDVHPNKGFILEYNNVKIGYTSDSRYFEEMCDVYDGLDVLIVNTLKFDKRGKGIDKHLSLEDFFEIYKKTNNRLYILTHFGRSFLNRNVEKHIFNSLRKFLKPNKRIIVARDLMEINL